jgi:outer membrane protein assembly factor BamB/chitodextrinase
MNLQSSSISSVTPGSSKSCAIKLILAAIILGCSIVPSYSMTGNATTIYAFPNVRKKVVLNFAPEGTGSSYQLNKAPLNGKVEYYDTGSGTYKPLTVGGASVTTTTWYYTGNAGFLGTDSFQATGTDSVDSANSKVTIIMKPNLYGKDWPQYCYDGHRSNETALELPSNLHLQWTWQLPIPESAWRRNVLQFDTGYEPVVAGKTLFVGFNGSDKLMALDTGTGAEKWRFYTAGPIRFAPVVTGGKVFVASDDGCLYCVDAVSGSELWKFRGGPSAQQVFGNRRMVSQWPIRGGPVLGNDGMIYFACGLMPMEGVFVYGINPSTGAVIWENDHSGTMTVDQPHDGDHIAGLSPQGYLVINRENTKVMVPSGHAMPGYFDRLTGKMDMPWYQGGTRNLNGAAVYVTADGVCLPPKPSISAGSKEYTTGPGITEIVHRLIAADDKLFVVTKTGKLYCFGGTSISAPPARSFPTVALPGIVDHWKTEVSTILSGLDLAEGSCVVVGIGSGRLVEELAKQSKFQIDVFDSDPAKVNALRKKLDDAKLYGGRTLNWVTSWDFKVTDTAKVAVHLMGAVDYDFPPYSAKLIVSEDVNEAGFGMGVNFVNRLFSGLRPYGGNIWLYTSATEHASFQSWVTSMSLYGASLSRNGSYSVLQRTGALLGATNFTKPTDNSPPKSPDKVAKAPFGTLWWDDKILISEFLFQADIVNGLVNTYDARNYDVYNGIPLSTTNAYSGWKVDPANPPESVRNNPFSGVSEPRRSWQGYGCINGSGFYGEMFTFRSATMAYYDPRRESGTVSLPGMRPRCGNLGMIPANGVLVMGGTSCNGCEYPLGTVIWAMVHRPSAQELATWGYNRNTNIVEDQPIRKVAFNFGAVGDRNENGVLWLQRPYSTPPTPEIPVIITPEASVERYSHHASWVQGIAGYPWVANTGLKGMNEITANLSYPAVLSVTTATPPAIDGSLSDSCWNGVGKIPMYHMNYKKMNPALDGEIQIRHDASKLYIACRYFGDVSALYKEAGWDVWLSDRVKLNTQALHFRVDRNGVKHEGISLKAGSTENNIWAGPWSSAYSKTTMQFIVEFAIPWSTLSGEGYDKTKLIMNVQGPGTLKDFTDVLRLRAMKDNLGQTIWSSSRHESCELFSAVSFDTVAGDLGKNRTYTVRMHFAEPDDLEAGKRKFDVKIQGVTKLTDFDVAAAAGGARKAVVKEFTNITIKDMLTVNFTPKVGIPVISGMEILETGGTPGDTTAPTVPTGLIASAVSSSQINLSWTASTDAVGVAGYNIYRGSTLVGTSSGTTYSDTGLSASTAYTYKVAAFDAAGNTSTQSSSANATTLAPTGDTTAPTIPTGLTASAVSSSQINLSWTASTDAVGVTGYKIYRGATQIATSAGTSYSDPGLTASTAYSYKVAAYDAAGNNSAQSSAANATTLPAAGGDSDGDGLPDSWEVTHFGSTSDARATPTSDPDGDGFTNLSEYTAGTSPVSAVSRLAVTDETFPSATSFKIDWQSVLGKTYEIQSSTDMITWTMVTTVTATSTTSSWTNTDLSSTTKKFYRVRIP